jgi:hypothetical protein
VVPQTLSRKRKMRSRIEWSTVLRYLYSIGLITIICMIVHQIFFTVLGSSPDKVHENPTPMIFYLLCASFVVASLAYDMVNDLRDDYKSIFYRIEYLGSGRYQIQSRRGLSLIWKPRDEIFSSHVDAANHLYRTA